jgi:FixJ family two-component response regulator
LAPERTSLKKSARPEEGATRKTSPFMSAVQSLSRAAPGLKPLVVVIDDDQAVVRSLEFALETEGFSVSSYYDADAYLASDRDEAGCLVVDYNLPGMNGIELLDELERRGRTRPFVIIASNPDRRCRRWVDDHGAALVEKPLLGAALTRMVWAAVRGSRH